jgi:hypothetical protein
MEMHPCQVLQSAHLFKHNLQEVKALELEAAELGLEEAAKMVLQETPSVSEEQALPQEVLEVLPSDKVDLALV